MTKKYTQLTTALLGALALAASSASAQTTTWTGLGSDDNINTAANWDNGLPTGGTQGTINTGPVAVNLFNLTGYDVIQNGGTATDTNGGLIANSSWVLNSGGTYDHTDANQFDVRDGSSFTVAGGDLNVTGKLRIANNTGSGAVDMSAGTINVASGKDLEFQTDGSSSITGGVATIGGNVSFVGTNGSLSITGGSVQATTLSINDGNSITLGGSGSLIFTSNANPGGGGLGATGTSTINFLDSIVGTSLITFSGGLSGPITYEGLWDSNLLLLGGQSKSDLGGIAFSATNFELSGTNNETLSLTVVPEPGTYALLIGCLALTGVVLRRRRG